MGPALRERRSQGPIILLDTGARKLRLGFQHEENERSANQRDCYEKPQEYFCVQAAHQESANGLSGEHIQVSDATNVFDTFAPVHVRAQFTAQVAHVYVDTAIMRSKFSS